MEALSVTQKNLSLVEPQSAPKKALAMETDDTLTQTSNNNQGMEEKQ